MNQNAWVAAIAAERSPFEAGSGVSALSHLGSDKQMPYNSRRTTLSENFGEGGSSDPTLSGGPDGSAVFPDVTTADPFRRFYRTGSADAVCPGALLPSRRNYSCDLV